MKELEQLKDAARHGDMAELNRLLESQAELDQRARVILIDVIANRSNSLLLASQLGVDHESPQVIIIKNNEVVYVASHMAIKPNTILPYL